MPENEKPPEEYAACVAWYESYGYNADNCPSPDPGMESLMAQASARSEAAKIPLPSPAVSPSTLAQINLQKCRVYLHSVGGDPDDCSKIPDLEFIDADKKFAVDAGCDREPGDLPGVLVCSGPAQVDVDGDSGIDSVTSFAPADWDIKGDFYGGGDDDARGLDWRGGPLTLELATDARATWVAITDKYGGRVASIDDDAYHSTMIRATLPAGRYIVSTGTDAKTGRVPYRLTLKAS